MFMENYHSFTRILVIPPELKDTLLIQKSPCAGWNPKKYPSWDVELKYPHDVAPMAWHQFVLTKKRTEEEYFLDMIIKTEVQEITHCGDAMTLPQHKRFYDDLRGTYTDEEIRDPEKWRNFFKTATTIEIARVMRCFKKLIIELYDTTPLHAGTPESLREEVWGDLNYSKEDEKHDTFPMYVLRSLMERVPLGIDEIITSTSLLVSRVWSYESNYGQRILDNIRDTYGLHEPFIMNRRYSSFS